jgi:hypothetical protein
MWLATVFRLITSSLAICLGLVRSRDEDDRKLVAELVTQLAGNLEAAEIR